MGKHFRRLAVTLLVILALASAAAVALLQTRHLSFYAAQRSGNQINRGDLVIVRKTPAAPRYVAAIPKAGYALDTLQKPYGLIALIYLPALGLALYEIKRLAGHYSYQPYDPGQRLPGR